MIRYIRKVIDNDVTITEEMTFDPCQAEEYPVKDVPCSGEVDRIPKPPTLAGSIPDPYKDRVPDIAISISPRLIRAIIRALGEL